MERDQQQTSRPGGTPAQPAHDAPIGKSSPVQRRYAAVQRKPAGQPVQRQVADMPDNTCWAQPVPVIITASRLRIRSQPNTSSSDSIVGRYSRGTRVEAIGRSGQWLMVQHQGAIGYIHGGYTEPAPDAQTRTAATAPAESSEPAASTPAPSASPAAAPATPAPAADTGGGATALSGFLDWLRALTGPTTEAESGTSPAAPAADASQTPAAEPAAEPAAATEPAATAPAADNGAGAGSALVDAILTVSDPDARIRTPERFRSTGESIPVGTRVRIIAAERTYVQVVTVGGGDYTATESDQIWTALTNLTTGGADVGMGNERTNAEARARAQELRGGLPPGRRPGTNTAQIKFSGHFTISRDGISLHGGLLQKLMRVAQWAIQNDMVTGDIRFGDGMRSPARAHKNSVAWHIQYDSGYDAMRRVRELSGGRDSDGNLWYQSGWTLEQVRANAHSVKPGRAIAAAGYPFGDQRRAPNPVNGREGLPSMGVSRHCSGGAIDVTFPWRKAGVDASTDETDVWGWDDILAQFGLERPLPKGHRFEEYWHIEETGMTLDPDAPPTPEGGTSPAP